eukprot:6389342-Amphidinium_carterae.1
MDEMDEMSISADSGVNDAGTRRDSSSPSPDHGVLPHQALATQSLFKEAFVRHNGMSEVFGCSLSVVGTACRSGFLRHVSLTLTSNRTCQELEKRTALLHVAQERERLDSPQRLRTESPG